MVRHFVVTKEPIQAPRGRHRPKLYLLNLLESTIEQDITHDENLWGELRVHGGEHTVRVSENEKTIRGQRVEWGYGWRLYHVGGGCRGLCPDRARQVGPPLFRPSEGKIG